MTVSIDFRNPESGNLGRHIASAAERRLPMVEKNCLATARGAVICGLGPSLQKPAVLNQVRQYAKRDWIVFGLKEALTFLAENRIRPHYSANMDPTVHEVGRTRCWTASPIAWRRPVTRIFTTTCLAAAARSRCSIPLAAMSRPSAIPAS